MGDLSDNFSRREFACRCGCGFDTVDAILIVLCEFVRYADGQHRMKVKSGCRCQMNNKNIPGAAEDSQHLYGRAADLSVRNPQKVFDALCMKWVMNYGFGLYRNRVHVDSRSGIAARWTI